MLVVLFRRAALIVAAGVVAALATATTTGAAIVSGPFKAVGLVDCEGGRPASQITMETTEDGVWLRTLSIKAVAGFRGVDVAKAGWGRPVGSIRIATMTADNNRLSYKLVTPKKAATGPVRLLSAGKLRVVYRPGRPTFLSIYGLPPETQYVAVATRRNTLLRSTADSTNVAMTGYLTGRPSETVTGDSKCAAS